MRKISGILGCVFGFLCVGPASADYVYKGVNLSTPYLVIKELDKRIQGCLDTNDNGCLAVCVQSRNDVVRIASVALRRQYEPKIDEEPKKVDLMDFKMPEEVIIFKNMIDTCPLSVAAPSE